MAFCGKCGNSVEEGVKFCPSCGAAMTTEPQQPQQEEAGSFGAKIASLNDTPDTTADFDQKDINENRGISVLSYLGPLVFIPMFVRKNSKYARFHANQGLTLFIVDVAYTILQSILMAILRAIFPWNWNYGYLGGRGFVYDALSTILSLVWVLISVLAVLGFINALRGKAKELPLIGKFKFLK